MVFYHRLKVLFLAAIAISFLAPLLYFNNGGANLLAGVGTLQSVYQLGYCTNKDVLAGDLERLIKIARKISKAHRHSRSPTTTTELGRVFQDVTSLLDAKYAELLTDTLNTSASSGELLDVCLEHYPHMKYGYPYYDTGYILHPNCTSKSIGELVTVMLNLVNEPISAAQLDSICKGVAEVHPNTQILAAIRNSKLLQNAPNCESAKTIPFESILYKSNVADGQIWLDLVSRVRTKYALVGVGLTHFNHQSELHRLVRMLSYLNVDIAGGSHRFGDGRWFGGCYQFGVANYTLKLVEGYDLSYNSCLHCDLVASGVFLVRPRFLAKRLDRKLTGAAVFVDLALTLRGEDRYRTMVCPDVMFYTRRNELHKKLLRQDWIPLAKKHELNRLILTNGDEHRFTCDETDIHCGWFWFTGVAMPLCCVTELADMTKYLMGIADRDGVQLEAAEGTLVGAVKFDGVLPWERDGDLDLQIANRSVVRKWIPEFLRDRNYQLVEEKTDYEKCEKEGTNCGYFEVRGTHWRIQLFGANYLGADYGPNTLGVSNYTKVLFDGMWVTSIHNPARFSRNKYGDDIFEHVEHWIALGLESAWSRPPTGKFAECPRPGFHGCLEQFLPTGNIQFQDIVV